MVWGLKGGLFVQALIDSLDEEGGLLVEIHLRTTRHHVLLHLAPEEVPVYLFQVPG